MWVRYSSLWESSKQVGEMIENIWVNMKGQWSRRDTCVRINYRLWSHGGYWMVPLWYTYGSEVGSVMTGYLFSGHICWQFRFAEGRLWNTFLTCWWLHLLKSSFENHEESDVIEFIIAKHGLLSTVGRLLVRKRNIMVLREDWNRRFQ